MGRAPGRVPVDCSSRFAGLEIGGSAAASGFSTSEMDLGTTGLRAWSDYIGRDESDCGDTDVHPAFVLPREAPGGEAVPNFAGPRGEPSPDEERYTDQQRAQEHGVPGVPLPSEVRLVGGQGQDRDDSADGDDEPVFSAQAAYEDDGRQAPDENPGGPVERP